MKCSKVRLVYALVSWQTTLLVFGYVDVNQDLLAKCPTPSVRKNTIIESNQSIRNGARLLGKNLVDNAKDCYELCCKDPTCNTAIMHYKEEDAMTFKYCFLFACGTPSVCTYRNRKRYAVIDLGSRADTSLPPTTSPPKVESTSAKVVTTTTTTTTATTTTTTTSMPTTEALLVTTNERSQASKEYPSPCHFALEAASGTHLLGVHIPDCNEDGTFKEKQCHSSTGYCWCVDPKNGSEIKGSRKGPTDGQVNCGEDVVVSANHNEQSVTVSATDYEEAPEEESLPISSNNLSEEQDDPYYTSERRQWVNQTNGACHRAVSSMKQHRGLVGAYIPQCAVDGTYRSKQCHGSTGFCWCVDVQSGGEIVGTRKGPEDGSDDMKCGNVVVLVQGNTGMTSFLSLPLLIALIICIVLFVGIIYRVRCLKRGRLAKKVPVDDSDYLINGMYL